MRFTRPRYIEPEHLSLTLVQGHRCVDNLPYKSLPPVFRFSMLGMYNRHRFTNQKVQREGKVYG